MLYRMVWNGLMFALTIYGYTNCYPPPPGTYVFIFPRKILKFSYR
jgi:hypothetical protein